MYKIPKDFPIERLLNKAVQQICFASNTIVISFGLDSYIQLYGSFSFQSASKEVEVTEIYPVINDFGLLTLLEKKIVKVNLNDKRDILQLEYEDEMVLTLIDNDYYESFFIKIGEKEILV